LVQAQLPSSTFESDDGKRLSFAHGMQGKAESVVRNEPIAYVFIPALKQWVEQVRPGAWLERLGLKHKPDPLSMQDPSATGARAELRASIGSRAQGRASTE
jgi:hypothetical protein